MSGSKVKGLLRKRFASTATIDIRDPKRLPARFARRRQAVEETRAEHDPLASHIFASCRALPRHGCQQKWQTPGNDGETQPTRSPNALAPGIPVERCRAPTISNPFCRVESPVAG